MSHTEPLNSVLPQRVPHVVAQALHDDLVICDDLRKRVHVLNPTATMVWRACDGKTTVASLAASMAARFRGARLESIEKDILDALEHLREEGLVEVPGKHDVTGEGETGDGRAVAGA